MISNLTPEERKRIVEEQGIRNKENLKTGIKTLGTVWLIIGGVLVLGFCVCLILVSTLPSFLNAR